MSNAIAERPAALATAPAVNSDQLDLIKRTVANGATNDELKLYLYDCQRHGVHPLDRLLHFTKRGGRYTPITSIDLMRIRAAETGDCLGISDPVFQSEPGEPDAFAATVTVKRIVQGQVAEFTATARWSEYCPPSNQAHMWSKMPHTMLGKCAEALALRKGFPKQLAGLYAKEEMDQGGQAAPESPREPEVIPVAPDGYDDFMLNLDAAADEGTPKFAEAFKAAPEPMRTHATKYDLGKLKAMKAKAAKVAA